MFKATMDGLSPSCSSLLLLGEGNFSFARSLCQKLHGDVNIIATSFENEVAVCRRKHGKENIDALTERGVTCLFGVDATTIHACQSLEEQTFDGIIFNFPHIAGKANIAKNRELLKKFFQSCVQKLTSSGQVLVTLCNGQGGTPADHPQREKQNSWQIVAMATYGDLILTRTVPFQAGAYQEYDSTGYRGQDKGFLTQQAVTHVFQRSEPILQLQKKEKLSSDVDGKNTNFKCPSDISEFMERNLLLQNKHPLSLLNASLVSNIQSLFPHAQVLQQGNIESVIHDVQKDGCTGVYTLEPMNIHESSNSFKLRPHLLCHIDALMDRYADKGCVLTGQSYHRCTVSLDSFPIMHQLLLALPSSDIDVAEVAAKILKGIHGDTSHLQIHSRNTYKDEKEDVRVAMETEGVNSLKRRHRAIDDKDISKDYHSVDSSQKYKPCKICLADQITKEQSLQLIDASGNQTIVGLCGNITRDATTYDIILLYLDQLIMHLLHIHDIRLLWSADTRMWEELREVFSTHQADGKVGLFSEVNPTSLHPPVYIRDISFWIQTADNFDELRFTSVLRQASGLLLKRVWLKEIYQDTARGDVSHCYRLEYQSCDQALSKEKVARTHQRVLQLLQEEMNLRAR